MKNDISAQKEENLNNNITNPTDNEYDIFNPEDNEEEEIEEIEEIDMENNKQKILFENPNSLHLYADNEKKFVDDNVNSFFNKENEGFFYFENSNNKINKYYNIIENKSLNKNNLFKNIFNEVFKFTKRYEFDYSIEKELYIITGKKIIFEINNNKNEEFLQKKKNKTIEDKKKHTRMDKDNIISHIKAVFFNNFILNILNLIITDIPNKKKCLKFNNIIIRCGKKEFNFNIFNSNLEILFQTDINCEERKHIKYCTKNILINNTKNFKYKNEEFLKQLKTKEMGIKILNFKVIELFEIFLKEDRESLISKNFQIDEKELKKIEIHKNIDENEKYKEKYEKIVEKIANQSFFKNINKGNNKNIEFHQMIPKTLTKLFVTKKMKK